MLLQTNPARAARWDIICWDNTLGGFIGELTLHPIAPPTKGVGLIAAPMIIAFNLILESVSPAKRPETRSRRIARAVDRAAANQR